MKTNRNTLFKTAVLLLTFGLAGLLCAWGQTTNFDVQAVQAAADRGDAKAQYELGAHYARGAGVEQDYSLAVKYVRESAEQGYAKAEVMLGSFYGNGQGVDKDVKTAAEWYRKAADQGNALAEFVMGGMYENGIGVTNSMAEAIRWWKQAAAQNQTGAEAGLGRVYLFPERPYGTNFLNYAAAIPMLRKAAAAGSTEAMSNLGVAYEHGDGLDIDAEEAARWYRKAAEAGNAQAQANLGQAYAFGRGVPVDVVQAYVWFSLSAAQGNGLGKTSLWDMQRNHVLDQKQLADAEAMVMKFKAKPAKAY